tara:strand:- start:1761 stop:5612 length:3852 start_codon:yes stop_codon:yes gene_type:complete
MAKIKKYKKGGAGSASAHSPSIEPTTVNDNIILRDTSDLSTYGIDESVFKKYLTVLAYVDSYHDGDRNDKLKGYLKSSREADSDQCPLRTLFNEKIGGLADADKYKGLFERCTTSLKPEDNTMKHFENDTLLTPILPRVGDNKYKIDDITINSDGTITVNGNPISDCFSVDFENYEGDDVDNLREKVNAASDPRKERIQDKLTKILVKHLSGGSSINICRDAGIDELYYLILGGVDPTNTIRIVENAQTTWDSAVKPKLYGWPSDSKVCLDFTTAPSEIKLMCVSPNNLVLNATAGDSDYSEDKGTQLGLECGGTFKVGRKKSDGSVEFFQHIPMGPRTSTDTTEDWATGNNIILVNNDLGDSVERTWKPTAAPTDWTKILPSDDFLGQNIPRHTNGRTGFTYNTLDQLLDFKRSGDWSQANIDDTVFLSFDRLAILYARMNGKNCIQRCTNHSFNIYKGNALKGMSIEDIYKQQIKAILNRLDIMTDSCEGNDQLSGTISNIESTSFTIESEILETFYSEDLDDFTKYLSTIITNATSIESILGSKSKNDYSNIIPIFEIINLIFLVIKLTNYNIKISAIYLKFKDVCKTYKSVIDKYTDAGLDSMDERDLKEAFDLLKDIEVTSSDLFSEYDNLYRVVQELVVYCKDESVDKLKKQLATKSIKSLNYDKGMPKKVLNVYNTIITPTGSAPRRNIGRWFETKIKTELKLFEELKSIFTSLEDDYNNNIIPLIPSGPDFFTESKIKEYFTHLESTLRSKLLDNYNTARGDLDAEPQIKEELDILIKNSLNVDDTQLRGGSNYNIKNGGQYYTAYPRTNRFEDPATIDIDEFKDIYEIKKSKQVDFKNLANTLKNYINYEGPVESFNPFNYVCSPTKILEEFTTKYPVDFDNLDQYTDEELKQILTSYFNKFGIELDFDTGRLSKLKDKTPNVTISDKPNSIPTLSTTQKYIDPTAIESATIAAAAGGANSTRDLTSNQYQQIDEYIYSLYDDNFVDSNNNISKLGYDVLLEIQRYLLNNIYINLNIFDICFGEGEGEEAELEEATPEELEEETIKKPQHMNTLQTAPKVQEETTRKRLRTNEQPESSKRQYIDTKKPSRKRELEDPEETEWKRRGGSNSPLTRDFILSLIKSKIGREMGIVLNRNYSSDTSDTSDTSETIVSEGGASAEGQQRKLDTRLGPAWNIDHKSERSIRRRVREERLERGVGSLLDHANVKDTFDNINASFEYLASPGAGSKDGGSKKNKKSKKNSRNKKKSKKGNMLKGGRRKTRKGRSSRKKTRKK